MNELALFAGIGGGILGGKLLGWRTICAVEIDAFCARRLMQRQNEGYLSPFPIWDDVCTFDGRAWRGRVDVVSLGFPCQNISSAGDGSGLNGTKSGLYHNALTVIRDVQPRFVLVENSPVLTSRGLGVVLGDLATLGYDANWGVLGDYDAGGHTERKRIWIVAYAASERRPEVLCDDAGRREKTALVGTPNHADPRSRLDRIRSLEQMAGEPAILGSGCGITDPVDRLHAVGNCQFPRVVKLAWNILKP